MLSTCSEYFEQIFERTQCKHPVIVLKDILYDDLEALLNYMYLGEVNVLQEKLAGLIKAAECLKIKGLAVPDEDPPGTKEHRDKRSSSSDGGPDGKRRKQDYSDITPVKSKDLSSTSSHRENIRNSGSNSNVNSSSNIKDNYVNTGSSSPHRSPSQETSNTRVPNASESQRSSTADSSRSSQSVKTEKIRPANVQQEDYDSRHSSTFSDGGGGGPKSNSSATFDVSIFFFSSVLLNVIVFWCK